jgi:hypothetical protein
MMQEKVLNLVKGGRGQGRLKRNGKVYLSTHEYKAETLETL